MIYNMVKPVPPLTSPLGSQPPHNRRAALGWLGDTLGAVLMAGGVAMAVDAAVRHRAPWAAAALLLASGLWRALMQAYAQIAGHNAALRHQTGISTRLWPALLPTRLQRGALLGEDLHLAVDSVLALEGWVARFLPLRMASGLAPLLVAAAVAPASWVAALIMLATLFPFILGMVLAGGAAARQAQAQHQALSRLSGLFVDRLRTLPAILAFGAEDRVTRHLSASAQEAARRTMAVLAVAFASSAILEFFAALSVALVAVYCGFALLGLLPFPAPEPLTLPRAFFALALAPEFYLGLRRLAAAYHDKQQGEAAMAAISAGVESLPISPAMIPPPRRWEGRAVTLAHPDGPRIGPLDWCWERGLHGLSGATGAGKSSTLLALVGQVPVLSGAILCDGQPFTPAALNPQIGWAGQSVALLPGTLRDNLAMGGAQDTAMLACLDALGLAPMLAMRGGLDMVIDHRGSGLSGGERRRIGLARALLSARPILLLDEPTADLDEASAMSIRTLLRREAQERLVVVASHDEALLRAANSVLEVA